MLQQPIKHSSDSLKLKGRIAYFKNIEKRKIFSCFIPLKANTRLMNMLGYDCEYMIIGLIHNNKIISLLKINKQFIYKCKNNIIKMNTNFTLKIYEIYVQKIIQES